MLRADDVTGGRVRGRHRHARQDTARRIGDHTGNFTGVRLSGRQGNAQDDVTATARYQIGRFALRPLLRPQDCLQHLAGAAGRHRLGANLDAARHLVATDERAAVADDLFRRYALAGFR